MMLELLFMLMVGHSVADTALQTNVMSQGKRRSAGQHWYMWLYAHSMIHGGAVYLITGNLGLGIAEVICHFIIDHLKCENKYSLKTDQLLHILCKVVWWYICIN